MALSFVKGQMLDTNLQRDGVSLAVKNLANSTPTLYLDVANGLVGINTSSPSAALEVVGNVIIGNVTISNIGTVNATANVSGGNITTVGNVSATGNVTGDYLLGNIYYANGYSSQKIFNGNSEVNVVSDGGNVNVSINGTPNIAVFTETGEYVTGAISASGNITANSGFNTPGTIYISSANGQLTMSGGDFTGVDEILANSVSTTGNVTVGNNLIAIGNVSGAYISSNTTVYAPGNITGGNLLTGGIVSATGNVTGGNLLTSGSGGDISGSGNITGGNFLTAGLVSAAGNATAGNIFTVGIISATGNIETANYYIGNGYYLTGIAAVTSAKLANGTSNVDIPVANGNVTVGIGGTDNVVVIASTGEYVTGIVSASGNVRGANLNTTGNVSATGNITGAEVSVTGNVTGGNILTGGLISATGNINGGNLISSALVSGTTVSATGNVIGGNVTTAGLITATGNLTSGNVNTGGLITATGNITGGNIITAGTVSAASVSASGNVNAANVNTNTIIGTGLTVTSTGDLDLSATGNVVLNSRYINGVLDPVQNQDAATKSYVDSVAQGLDVKASVYLASTSSIAPYTYNNGASGVGATLTSQSVGTLSLDGQVVTANSRVLIKSEVGAFINDTTQSAAFNGIYLVTQTGNASTPFILTRTPDFDNEGTQGQIPGAFTFIEYGNSLADTGWVCTTDNPVVMGTTQITFVQFSGAGTYSANTQAGISLTGTVFSAKVDQITTYFDGGGNIAVKPSANLTTPNIGNATGNSLIVTGNGLLQGTTVSATGNVIGGNVTTVGLISATGNATAGNVTTAGAVSATGNVVGGNVTTAGLVSATGNVTGGNIFTAANGQVSADGNVTGFNVNTFNGGNVSAAGNVIAANSVNTGNISLSGNVISNLNVTGNAAASNFNTQGRVSAAGSVTGSNIYTAGEVSAGGNVTGANIFATGYVSATGNVYANGIQSTGLSTFTGSGAQEYTVKVKGDGTGSQLGVQTTNTPADGVGLVSLNSSASGYANLNLEADNINFYTGSSVLTNRMIIDTNGVVSVIGNAVAGNVNTGGQLSAGGNVTGANLITGGLITATGNVTGGNINTTGLVSTSSNVVAGNLTTVGQVSASANITGGNILTAGQVSATGNITTANYFVGNGYYLTGLVQNRIFNGNSYANIATANANLVIAIGNSSNIVATFYDTGVNFTGPVSTTGNVTGSNLITGGQVTATGNVTGGNVITSGYVSATGNVNGGNINTTGFVSTTGNVNAGNVNSGGIYVIGTTAGNVFYAGTNGQLVTDGVHSFTYTAAQSLLSAGNVSATGNVTGNNVNVNNVFDSSLGVANVVYTAANGQLVTDLVRNFSYDSATSLLSVGNVSATGNVKGANLVGANIYDTSIGTSNVIFGGSGGQLVQDTASPFTYSTGGALLTAGNVSATGNVKANIVVGANIYDTNIGASNVIFGGAGGLLSQDETNSFTYATAGSLLTAGNISATGNVKASNLNGTTVSATGNVIGATVSASGNVIAGNVTTVGQISATGNIETANYFVGNGYYLTGLTPFKIFNGNSYANINTANANLVVAIGNSSNVVATFYDTGVDFAGPVSVVGNVKGSNLITGGLVSANGNVLAGNITSYGAANIVGNLNAGNINDVNIVSANTFNGTTANLTGNVYGANILASTFLSSGGNVVGANINTSGIVSSTGNVIGGNINTIGEMSSTGNAVAGNVLTGGMVSAAGNVDAGYLFINHDAQIEGNLVVNGNTTFINSNTITTNDKNITLANNQSNAANVDGAGIDVANSNVATWRYNFATSSWQSNIDIDPVSNNVLNLGNVNNYWNVVYTNQVTATGNVSANNLNASNVVSALGNIIGGNITTVGMVSALGNIETGNYIVGNGYYITGINAAVQVQKLVNGNSYANIIAPSSNLVVAIGANSNIVATFYDTGVNLKGNLSANGNVTVDQDLTVSGNTYLGQYGKVVSLQGATDLQLGSGSFSYGTFYSISGISGNISGNAISANGAVSANGNITGANINILGQISALGNISTGNYFVGNGYYLTGLTPNKIFNGGTYANIATANANLVVAVGNSSNTVATFYDTGVNFTGPVSVNGNVTGGNVFTSGSGGNISGTGDILAGGNVSAIGNVTGGNVTAIGTVYTPNVTNLTNSVYVTANTKSWQFSNNGNLYTPESGQIRASSSFYGITISDYSSLGVLSLVDDATLQGNARIRLQIIGGTQFDFTNGLANLGSANLSTTGNVLAGYVSASGNVTGNYLIASGGNTVINSTISTTGNIDTSANINQTGTGNINGYNGYFGGNVTVIGNLLTTSNIVANIAGIFYGDVNTGNGALYAGIPGFTPLASNVVVQIGGNVNSYSQVNFQNINDGTLASTDYIATADNGNDSVYFLDMGIASSNHSDPDFFGDNASNNDAYMYVVGSDQTGPSIGEANLILGSTNGNIKLFVGNTAQANVIEEISANGVYITGVVSATGNITSNSYFVGNGVYLTGVAADNVNANALVGNTLSANVLYSSLTSLGNVGNLSVVGNTTSGNIASLGAISASGNITSNSYVLGNGAFLTGVITSVANINNGTSNVSIYSANANVNISVNGNANVATFAIDGLRVSGLISATGNITGQNIYGNILGPIPASSKIIYVAKNGSDSNDGGLNTPFLTIKAGLAAAATAGGNVAVHVAPGNYTEANPVTIPANTALMGDNLRNVQITPATPAADLFYVKGGCYVWGVTIRDYLANGFSYDPSTPSQNVFVSPYIQNITSYTTTGTAVSVDGSLTSSISTKAMIVGFFTIINRGGRGVYIFNGGYSQLVNIYTIACDVGIKVESGGFCTLNGSDCSIGNYGLIANGVGTLQCSGNSVGYSTQGTFVINGLTPTTPHVNTVMQISGDPEYYTIDTIVPIDAVTATVVIQQIYTGNLAPSTPISFYTRSAIIASAHTFEYVGAGTNPATALPQYGGIPIDANEVIQTNGGVVTFTSTDQKGNFKVGNGFIVNQATSTITGDAFYKSLFAQMTPFILALSEGS
jgi:hypothetical protein